MGVTRAATLAASLAASLAATLALAGCVTAPKLPDGALVAVDFLDMPGWKTDTIADGLQALRTGCARLKTLPVDTALGGLGIARALGGTAASWASPCSAADVLASADDQEARQFFETWFTPYRVAGPARYTGYYDPEIAGSLVRTANFTVPVYGRPADLLVGQAPTDSTTSRAMGRLSAGHLVPYWTRAEIEAGAMGSAATPIAYVASAVDLFFLQVQGSGRIRLPHGGLVRVGFEAKNGRPYTPIGRVLVARGAITADQVSLQTLRAWLLAHPKEAPAVMAQNQSYVFFRLVPDADPALGPPGALGAALTPQRSAAVDRRFMPLGAPLFVDTVDPLTGDAWRHVVIAQDLGSDINGAARVDLFMGAGAQAEARAGRMHGGGALFVLLPRGQD